jgi:hypothetical protein
VHPPWYRKEDTTNMTQSLNNRFSNLEKEEGRYNNIVTILLKMTFGHESKIVEAVWLKLLEK